MAEITEKEQEAAGMQYALQLYQERYGNVNSAMARLMNEITSLRESDAAVSSLHGKAGRPAMINAGMGFMVDASLGRPDRVAVAIGGRIIAEKSIDEAKAIIAERVSAREAALGRLRSERKELESAIYSLTRRLQGAVA